MSFRFRIPFEFGHDGTKPIVAARAVKFLGVFHPRPAHFEMLAEGVIVVIPRPDAMRWIRGASKWSGRRGAIKSWTWSGHKKWKIWIRTRLMNHEALLFTKSHGASMDRELHNHWRRPFTAPVVNARDPVAKSQRLLFVPDSHNALLLNVLPDNFGSKEFGKPLPPRGLASMRCFQLTGFLLGPEKVRACMTGGCFGTALRAMGSSTPV